MAWVFRTKRGNPAFVTKIFLVVGKGDGNFARTVALEIERKYLVSGEPWHGFGGTEIAQFYLASGNGATVRVRTAGKQAWLTVKGPASGCVRAEFEYEIPLADARALRRIFPDAPGIEKTRYRIPHEGWCWEVDVFHGRHQGLLLAEIELPAPDAAFPLPEWAGEEVTGDPRFFNANLARRRC